MRGKLQARRGFTLIELMVALAIMLILATLAGAGLAAYARRSRFARNEANARTVCQAAQLALARLAAADGLDAWLAGAADVAVTGVYSTPDGAGAAAEAAAYPDRVRVLFYDKADPGTAAGRLTAQLLEPYIYDAALLNASLALEIDMQTGKVFSVFYDSEAARLRFGAQPNATDITDRSAAHRRAHSLVGYYAPGLVQSSVPPQREELRIQGAALVNGETLALSWRGSAAPRDVEYTATLLRADGAPLCDILVPLAALETDAEVQYSSGAALARLTVFAYDANGVREQTGTEMWFPLRCAGGVFTLTLDAMASAELLGRCAASDALQRTSLYSVTRLPGLETPQDIFVRLTARPAQQAAACYTASRPVLTGRANTLLAEDTEIRGGVLYGRIASFRHLYNLRWLTGRYAQADLLLTAAELDWTGGAALVYQAPQAGETRPWADSPAPAHAVAFPTVPELPRGWSLNGGGHVLSGLQLRGASVFASGGQAECIGLFGRNAGAIQNLTLRRADVQVNWRQGAASLALPGLRAVGALCGENTGRVRNAAGSVQVRAALALPQRAGADTPAAGIGGLVGVSLAGQDAGLYALECEGEVTGLLLGASAVSSGGQADPAARCRAAQQVWQPAGVGGVAGFVRLPGGAQAVGLRLSNAAAVYGNACAGGVVGSLEGEGAVLAGARNSGPVQALAGYDAAVSPLAGQFFGGVAGYSAGVTLQGCRNTAAPAQENPPQGDFTGGLVGFLCGGMANCETGAQAAVYGGRFVGGLAGAVCGGTVADSRSAGAVCGQDLTGGAVGCTAADAVLENCAATGSVTALAGSAGGLAGRNEGTIRGGTPGGGAPLTVCAQSGCAGGFAACNTGTVENAALSLDTLRLTGAAGVAGGVAGCNAGAVRGVTVTAQDPWDLTGLTAASLTAVGGAVGENAGTLEETAVSLSVSGGGALGRIRSLGGLAGGNTGTVCGTVEAFAAQDAAGASGPGDAVGGAVGRNAGTVQGCRVSNLTLQLAGCAESGQAAGGVGGLVGCNTAEGLVRECVIGGEQPCTVQANAGAVGGLCGFNAGRIEGCGGAAPLAKLPQFAAWLQDGEAGADAMTEALARQELALACGSDPLATAATPATAAAANELTAALYGSGCVGGLTGRNAATGTVTGCASGAWLVCSADGSAPAGGCVGENAGGTLRGLLNCAAVRAGAAGTAGGIAGSQADGALCENCVNFAPAAAPQGGSLGGVIGVWQGGGVTRCFNYGAVTGAAGAAGGVAGAAQAPAQGTLRLLSCRNYGAVTAAHENGDAAGIVGRVQAAAASCATVTLRGCVNAAPALRAGALACGICGRLDAPGAPALYIERCRSYSPVLDAPAAAGVCGPCAAGGELWISGCFAVYDAPGGSPIACGPWAGDAVHAQENFYLTPGAVLPPLGEAPGAAATAESAASRAAAPAAGEGGQPLFLGTLDTAAAAEPYFAALLTEGTDAGAIGPTTHAVAPDGRIVDAAGRTAGVILFRFGETNGQPGVQPGDIRDRDLRRFYAQQPETPPEPETPQPTPEPSPLPTATPEPTPGAATPQPTAAASPTPTAEPTPTPAPTPGPAQTPAAEPSPSPAATPTAAPSPLPTATPAPTPADIAAPPAPSPTPAPPDQGGEAAA